MSERYFCQNCPEQEEFTEVVVVPAIYYKSVDATGMVLDERRGDGDYDNEKLMEVTCDSCGEEAEWGDPRSALEQIASVMEGEDE